MSSAPLPPQSPLPHQSPQPEGPSPASGLGLTTVRQLLVAALAGAVLGYFVVGTFQLCGSSAPVTPWSLPTVLLVLGVAALGLAPRLRHTVVEQRAALSPERALQALALGKSLLMGGAIIAGAHVVYAVFFSGHWEAELPRQRVIRGALTIVAALVMALGGRAVERACVVPPADDDGEATVLPPEDAA